MNKKIIALLITTLVLIFSMVTLSLGQFIPNAPFKSAEVIAPDFSLKDLQGKTFKLSRYYGKPVLLFFGATWCPSCRAEIPAYKNIYTTYSKSSLEVVYIDIMEPVEKVARFAKTNSLTYKVLIDEDGNVADNYGIIGVPTLILIDKKGYVAEISYRTSDLHLNMLFPAKR
jgi:peroxiredoxin